MALNKLSSDEGEEKVKNEAISFKDITKAQLDALKELYINSRVESMSELDLRKFVREVFDLQVKGTVGAEEEREVWKEMKEHFDENFEQKINEVIKAKGSDQLDPLPEEVEFQKRLELLEQRKKEESKTNSDMW